MSSRTQAISPILRVTKLSFEYDKVFTKEKMKFNNGDEIFTKKLIRSIAKQVGLPARQGGRKRIPLPRLVKYKGQTEF